MNMGPTPEEAKKTNDAIDAGVNFIFSKAGVVTIVLVVLVAAALIYGIWSVVNGWVQCMDGSNYAREIVDGETLYLNQCE